MNVLGRTVEPNQELISKQKNSTPKTTGCKQKAAYKDSPRHTYAHQSSAVPEDQVSNVTPSEKHLKQNGKQILDKNKNKKAKNQTDSADESIKLAKSCSEQGIKNRKLEDLKSSTLNSSFMLSPSSKKQTNKKSFLTKRNAKGETLLQVATIKVK